MQFIEFNELGSVAFDLSDFLPQSFDPLIDRHILNPKTRPMDRKPKPSKYRVNAKRRWSGVAVSDLWETVKKY